MAKNLPSAMELANEIWCLIECDQGKSFISDGLDAAKSRRQVFDVVRGSLKHAERSVKNTRAFLKKYGEL